MAKDDLKKGDKVYYARIMPTVGVYELCELYIRTVEENYFVGIEKKDKRAYLFSYADLNNSVFQTRRAALEKVKIAEENKSKQKFEMEYEEY